jgi:hypothetical protein
MKSDQSRESSLAPSLKRRAAYTLAAAAAASGLASDADAAIVYVNPEPDLVVPLTQFPNQQSYSLNLDGDAYTDVLFDNFVFGGGNYQAMYVNFAPGRAVGFFGNFAYASSLAAGAPINAAAITGGPFDAVLAYPPNPQAQFANASGSYIGLGFPIGGVNHFGWIRVDINNTAGTFTIRDWAYESVAGTAINAGAIPEPTTLGMLAGGALGLAALRRRRAAA